MRMLTLTTAFLSASIFSQMDHVPLNTSLASTLPFVLPQAAAASSEASVPTKLRVATSREIESLDPLFVDGPEAGLVASALFEGLTVLHPETAQPEAGGAEGWSVSSDGLVYTFRLNPGSLWSDGKPVRAADYLFAWKRALEPTSGAYYGFLFDCIKGAEHYRKGEVKDFSQVGLRSTGDHHLEVTLRAPTPYFPELVSSATFFPLREDKLKAFKDQAFRSGNIIGNGPFVLAEWKHKQRLSLQKNPNYVRAADVKLEGAEIYPIESFKTALNMYEAGDIDWLTRLPPHLIADLEKRPDFRTGPKLSTVYLRFNTKGKAFADVRLRRAISMSIDRKILAEKVAREGQIPAQQFVAPGLYTKQSEPLVTFNPQEARKLVAEVKEEKGMIPDSELLFISDEQSNKVAQAISLMLKKNLDINVAPKNLERGVFYGILDENRHDLARSSFTARFFDPVSFLEKFTSDNITNNLTGFADKKFDELIAAAQQERNSSKREELLKAAERILILDAAAVVPLYHNTSIDMWKGHVSGLFTNPLGVHPLRSVSLASSKP
jgi:oligopeptide transport system substrate-binding protein